MRFAGYAGFCLSLVLGVAPVARATCDPTTDPDKTDIANARAAIAAYCDCATATSHGAYEKCVAQQVSLLANKSCASALKRCAARSTCGKPGAVTCCVTKAGQTKCKIKHDAAHCTAPAGATACVGIYASCCDACGAGGCATTTTTSTSSTTTTTAETGPPCGGDIASNPSCNGTCSPGMACAYFQPSDACTCVPGATCQQSGYCLANDCSNEPCPPGYTCAVIQQPFSAICIAGQCGFGCLCPPGGVCAVFQ